MSSIIERIWALVSPTTTLTITRPRPPRLATTYCRCGLAWMPGYACYCQHGTTYHRPRGGGAMRMVRHRTYRRALDRAAAAEAEVERLRRELSEAHTWADQVRDATHRQICAYRAGGDQVLADLRTIRRQLLDANLCADCETKARVAVDSLGPLIGQAAALRSTLDGTS